MSIDAYGIHIGFLYFRYYGMILVFSIIMASLMGRYMLRKMGKDPDLIWDGLIWLLVFGLIGARLYHVLTPSKFSGITTEYYLRNPIAILTTWQGGLGIPGAIIGGVIGAYIFARRRGLKILGLLDAGAPAIALAQVLGRWANFINQELYGQPTDLPWCITIRPENRLPGFASFDCFHPLFLYESLWSLGNMFFLLWLWNRFGNRMKEGDLFLTYLITYPVGRFLLEYLRLDYVQIMGLNFNQAFMLVVALLSAAAIFLRHRPIFRKGS
ncbi:MAG: prolipoprotein diacylglyceryl transferase [Anaerolineales bacterium]|nr:prolipoprotein diacylglyceryl transferase [Anaerolineales bacterium]